MHPARGETRCVEPRAAARNRLLDQKEINRLFTVKRHAVPASEMSGFTFPMVDDVCF